MEKKKTSKFNILFAVLLVITMVTTTYAWILDVEPIVAQLIEYKQGMIISPSTMEARLEYGEGEDKIIIENDTRPDAKLFNLNKMVPGKMYNFHFFLKNKSEKASSVSIYFDGINFEENANGKTLQDKIWFRVQMLAGYDANLLPPDPEFIKLNDTARLTYKPTQMVYDYELLRAIAIMPASTNGEAEFLISIMIDTSADSTYESTTFTIDNIRVDV